ncbi:LPD38 domain-containing protein (plasmid) [Azospirillum sp. A26]|uniref:LPD38 domain-containing protein n=1 Tax=Azospirillum sp. A26 TaxID=3160607 RepID=UPI00366F54EE
MDAESFLDSAPAGNPVDDYVAEASSRFGVAPDLIRATMGVESAGDARAVSNKGAAGLMQLMPGTFDDMRRQHGLGSDRFEPRTNVLAGTAYLRQMLDRYQNDPSLALAAYNAGPGTVDDYRAGRRSSLPAETRAYVPKVLGGMRGRPTLAGGADDDGLGGGSAEDFLGDTGGGGAGDGVSAEDFLSDVKAPPKPAPGIIATFGTAAARGAGEAIRNTANAPSFSQERPAEAKEADGIDELLTTPISKGWTDPKWWAAQIGSGLGGSAPTVAAGIAGGAAGSAVAGPPGALVGSALGFGGGSFVQSLAPEYQRARADGLDHDAAVDRALQQSGIAGAFGAAMGLAPGVGLFGKTAEGAIKRPISEALAQIFGVQPALGVGQRATQNAAAGRETTAEELLQDYALNVGAGATMVTGHKAVERMGRRGAKPEEAPAVSAEEPQADNETLALPAPQPQGEGFVMGDRPEVRQAQADVQRFSDEMDAAQEALRPLKDGDRSTADEAAAAPTPEERDALVQRWTVARDNYMAARNRLDNLTPQPPKPEGVQPPDTNPPLPPRNLPDVYRGATDDPAMAALPPDATLLDDAGRPAQIGMDRPAGLLEAPRQEGRYTPEMAQRNELAAAEPPPARPDVAETPALPEPASSAANRFMEAQSQQAADLQKLIDRRTREMGALQKQIAAEPDPAERTRKTDLFRQKNRQVEDARARLEELRPQEAPRDVQEVQAPPRGRDEGVQQAAPEASPILTKGGKPFPTERAAANVARTRPDLKEQFLVPVEVNGGWGLMDAGAFEANVRAMEKPFPAVTPWQMTKAEAAAWMRSRDLEDLPRKVAAQQWNVARMRRFGELEPGSLANAEAELARLREQAHRGEPPVSDLAPFHHREAVRRALAEGQPVSERVLAEYPELRAGEVQATPQPGDRVRVTNAKTGQAYEATLTGERGPRTLVTRDDGKKLQPLTAAHSIERVEGDRFRLTDEAERAAPALEADLRAQLKRYGIDDRVGFRLVDAIRDRRTGEAIPGALGRYGRRVIEVATSAPDRAMTLDHEAVHAIRELGLLTQKQWDALKQAALRDDGVKLASVRRRYKNMGLDEESMFEEAVADLFADWQAGRRDAGAVRAILERIRDFFAAVGQAFRGQGFTTPESVFRAIDEGRIGRRGAQEQPAGAVAEAFERQQRPEGQGEAKPERDSFALAPTEQALADAILADQPSLAERVKKAFGANRSGIGSEAVRQLVNQFQPIFDLEMRAESKAGRQAKLRDARVSAAKMTELAVQDSGRLESMLVEGPLRWNATEGIVENVKGGGGLLDIFKPLKSADDYKRFQLYAIAKRTEGVTSRDRQAVAGWRRELAQVERQTETNEKALASIQNDPAMAQKRQKLEKAISDGREMIRKLSDQIDDKTRRIRNLTGFMTDAQVKEALAMETPEFKKVFDGYQKFNRAMLDFAVDTGVIKAASRDIYANGMDYVPFYRVAEETGELPPPATLAKLSNPDPKIRKLEGGTDKIGDLAENVIRNATALAKAGMRNEAMRRIHGVLSEIGEAKNLTAADEKAGSAAFFDKGVKRHFVAEDPAVMAAMAGLRPEQQAGIYKGLASFSNVLRRGVTASPGFMLANFIRDSASAWVQTGGTLTLANNGITGLIRAAKKADSVKELKAAAGIGGYEFGHGARDMAAEFKRRLGVEVATSPKGILDKIVYPLEKGKRALDAALRPLEEVGSWTEVANRDAIYRNLLDQGASKAEAAYQALNLLNFSRKGANQSLRFMLPLVPFLNARIQGLYRLAETQGDKAALKGVFLRGLLLTGVSAALTAAFGDDDRVKDAPLERRLSYYIVPVGDSTVLIPKPFEFGAIFSTMPEFLFDAIQKSDGGDLMKATAMTFLNTFQFNPVPQAVKPALEVYTNYDFFTERPVEGPQQQKVRPGERADARTNATLAALGREANISPMKAEHLIGGYLGTLGQMALAGMDAIMGASGAVPSKPAGAFGSVPILSPAVESAFGRFYKTGPDAANRWVGDFYDLKHQADETWSTIRKLRQDGELDRAKELQRDNAGLVGARKQIEKMGEQIGGLTRRINDIRSDDEMSPDEKRAKMDDLIAKRNAIAKRTEGILQKIKERNAAAVERNAA